MIERTTVAATAEDLQTLRDEARRQGVSLSSLLRAAVAREARELRAARRPRFGLGASRSDAAQAAQAASDEPLEAAGPGR